MPPRLTVTEIDGGESFTAVPDRCVVGVDVRLTDVFDEQAAAKLLGEAVIELDSTLPAPRATTFDVVMSWPPFILTIGDQPAAALLAGARAAGVDVRAKVAGPTNIGNFLQGLGFRRRPASVCRIKGCMEPTSGVRLDALPTVQAAYHHAALSLMGVVGVVG